MSKTHQALMQEARDKYDRALAAGYLGLAVFLLGVVISAISFLFVGTTTFVTLAVASTVLMMIGTFFTTRNGLYLTHQAASFAMLDGLKA